MVSPGWGHGGSSSSCPCLEDRSPAGDSHLLAGSTEPGVRRKSCKPFSSPKVNPKCLFLACVAHSPDLCCFQGDSGRDGQQRGPKGETGDIGPMVSFLDAPCRGPGTDLTRARPQPQRPREGSLRPWTREDGSRGLPEATRVSMFGKSPLGTEATLQEGLLCGTRAPEMSMGSAGHDRGSCRQECARVPRAPQSVPPTGHHPSPRGVPRYIAERDLLFRSGESHVSFVSPSRVSPGETGCLGALETPGRM